MMSEQEKILHGKSEKLKLGQWLLLLYVAVAFVLVLAALAVHTLTQSGGIVQVYLFLPAAAGLSAVLIGGGILFFGEGVKAVRSPGLAHIRHLPRGFSVVCYLACGAAALAFGVFLLITTVAAPLGDIAYLNRPEIVELSQVELELDNWSDATNVSMKGIADDGRDYEFNVGDKVYEQWTALESSGGAETKNGARISYLPYTRTVVGVELWEE